MLFIDRNKNCHRRFQQQQENLLNNNNNNTNQTKNGRAITTTRKQQKTSFVSLLLVIVSFVVLFKNVAAQDQSNQKVCSGTSSGFSSSRKVYQRLRATFTNCVYVDGNVEITNFDPVYEKSNYSAVSGDDSANSRSIDYNAMDAEFDFSFLDNIREITGYLLVHNTKIKSLRFKSLEIVRGKKKIRDLFSVFIDSNTRLDRVDLTKLKAVQSGSVYVRNNPRLCHMNEVKWEDIFSVKQQETESMITDNADVSTCPKCSTSCCDPNDLENCGCWFPNGCQKLSKVVCNDRCEDRCYVSEALTATKKQISGNKKENKNFDNRVEYGCCNAQCLGGCTGPTKRECLACKNLRINETGECVESCPRIQEADPHTREIVLNPNGTYQYGITCVRQCPASFFIYQDYCLARCPNNTYEEEELINNPETGEKGFRRVCKQCTREKCPKTCVISKELTVKDLDNVRNCEILNSDLLIFQPNNSVDPNQKAKILPELTESDLEALKNIRVINGFVRIQSNSINSLSFLRNLEVIRANKLYYDKISLAIRSSSLKYLGLLKLKKIEIGNVLLETNSACLEETIDWTAIINKNNSYRINNKLSTPESCAREGYECDRACRGCWAPGPKACQFCKEFKLDDTCVQSCADGRTLNKRYTYVAEAETRECKYCHPECKDGCNGPTEYDCLNCSNYEQTLNDSSSSSSLTPRRMCVNKCLSTHYADKPSGKCLECNTSCYGCTGPLDILGERGCTSCNSALVHNDASYSMIRCIDRNEFNCSANDGALILVPPDLNSHPMRGKTVCRKCNSECDGCLAKGAILGEGCKKCRNFYSRSTNECVSNCPKYNEYLEINTNNCLTCNSECNMGCSGPKIFECNQCRAYKLRLADLKKIVDTMVGSLKSPNNVLSQVENESYDQRQINLASALLNETRQPPMPLNGYDDTILGKTNMFNLIQNYQEYYVKKVFWTKDGNDKNDDDQVFCVSQCPESAPFSTDDYFCSAEKLAKNYVYSIWRLIVLFATISIIALAGTLVLSTWCLRRIGSSRIKDPRIDIEKEPIDPEPGYFDWDNMANRLLIIENDELRLERELGAGAFGRVFAGYWIPNNFEDEDKKVKVAIKQLQPLIDKEKCKEFHEDIINEATLMASVNHKHCLQLTGLCLVEPVRMVFQLMRYGSVVQFYQNANQRASLTAQRALKWAEQIADGMCYLESRGIVHRDLAARNILIKSHDHIVITDFGLAKMLDSSEKAYFAKKNSLLPIKWMAIESIREREFTHKSDVWSYGVCLWEIFTFCAKPYAEIETADLLKKILAGVRLSAPQMCTLNVYNLMIRCWLVDPDSRPTFKDLSSEFKKFAANPHQYIVIKSHDQDPTFVTINNGKEIAKIIVNMDQYKFTDYNMDEETDAVYVDGSGTNSTLSDSQKKSSDTNLSPDEGVGDSADVCPLPPTSRLPKKGATILASLRPDSTVTDDAYSRVITFKRSASRQNNDDDVVKREDNTLDEYSNVNETTTHSNHHHPSMRFFRRILQQLPLNKLVPKRQQSQTSTGTTSSYLSSNYSSGEPEDSINGETTIMIRRSNTNNSSGSSSDHKKSNSDLMLNYVEEKQLLIPPSSQRSNSSSSNDSSALTSPSTPYMDSPGCIYEDQAMVTAHPASRFPILVSSSSSPPTTSLPPPPRHNNNNSIYNSKLLRTSSTARNRDSENTNSDYLEPVSHNVRQNSEYFNSRVAAAPQSLQPVTSKIESTTNKQQQQQQNYYNVNNVSTYIEDPNPVI